ncbi:hypothetical protein AMECASPLE_016073, partial [Ameca splendens]
PVEVARASISDASWTPSSGGVPGTSHREEAQGTAQDTLEGLCLLAGLGTPWAPLGGGVCGEGRLGISAESAAPTTRSRIKRKTASPTRKPAARAAVTPGCSPMMKEDKVMMSKATGSSKGTVESACCPTGTLTTRFRLRTDNPLPTSSNPHDALSKVVEGIIHV